VPHLKVRFDAKELKDFVKPITELMTSKFGLITIVSTDAPIIMTRPHDSDTSDEEIRKKRHNENQQR